MLYQKRQQRRKFVASSESAAVASDTTLGLIVTNSIGLATNRQDQPIISIGSFSGSRGLSPSLLTLRMYANRKGWPGQEVFVGVGALIVAASFQSGRLTSDSNRS